jgi:hypothetical protein
VYAYARPLIFARCTTKSGKPGKSWADETVAQRARGGEGRRVKSQASRASKWARVGGG